VTFPQPSPCKAHGASAVETTSQFGSRVNTTRKDAGVGGGGRLEFGKFREDFEQAVQNAGWKFIYEIA